MISLQNFVKKKSMSEQEQKIKKRSALVMEYSLVNLSNETVKKYHVFKNIEEIFTVMYFMKKNIKEVKSGQFLLYTVKDGKIMTKTRAKMEIDIKKEKVGNETRHFLGKIEIELISEFERLENVLPIENFLEQEEFLDWEGPLLKLGEN